MQSILPGVMSNADEMVDTHLEKHIWYILINEHLSGKNIATQVDSRLGAANEGGLQL